MDFKGLKIGVLGGGISGEREISLLSAKGVYESLVACGLDAVFIDIITSDEEEVKNLLLAHKLDAAFIALHGAFGEDGRIQSILESIGLSYTGSGPRASLLTMDKILSKKVFENNNISTPAFFICSDSRNIPKDVTYPVVVKPHFCGSSLGVTIVEDKDSLEEAIKKALSFSPKVILEEYIKGRELTVGILDDKALAVVEIIPKNGTFDFEAKYTKGKTSFIVPAKLNKKTYEQTQAIALAAHRALGCRGFCRVDMRLNRDNIPYVLEVNSIPGLTNKSLLPLAAKACGYDFNKLVLKLIELALYGKKETQKVQTV